jgi:hypothetical protein
MNFKISCKEQYEYQWTFQDNNIAEMQDTIGNNNYNLTVLNLILSLISRESFLIPSPSVKSRLVLQDKVLFYVVHVPLGTYNILLSF